MRSDAQAVASEAGWLFARRHLLLVSWWLLTAAAAAAGTVFAFGKVVDHDVAYWIHAAGRLLDGAVLYRDLIELNPPTNYLLMLLPVGFARAAGLDPLAVFNAFVLLLALASTVLCVVIVSRMFPARKLLPQLIVLPLAVAFLIAPGNDFGQREHILAMLLLPYLLLAAAEPGVDVPPAVRLAAGLMAGAVIAYKPYFALYPAVAEGLRLLQLRRLRAPLRTETLSALGVVALLVLVTLAAFPRYLDEIVPLGRAIYGGFEASPAAVVAQAHFWTPLLLLAIALTARRSVEPAPLRRCATSLGGAAIAALVIYLVQMKGWPYQALPAAILACAALGVVVAARAEDIIAGARGRSKRAPALMALCMGAAGLMIAVQLHAAHARDQRIRAAVSPLVSLVQGEAKGGPVLFLSTHLPYAFPVVNYAQVPWPYRYHHLLPLPGLYRSYAPAPGRAFRKPEEMGSVEKRFFDTVVEDVLRHPPRIIFVDTRRQFVPISELGFDFLAYFRQDPRFDALLRHYRPAGQVSRHDVLVRAD